MTRFKQSWTCVAQQGLDEKEKRRTKERKGGGGEEERRTGVLEEKRGWRGGAEERSRMRGGDLVNMFQAALAHSPIRESLCTVYRTKESPLLQ